MQNAIARGAHDYHHEHYERRRRALRWLLARVGWPLFAKIDVIEDANRVPSRGPAILVVNHIAMIDPVVVMGHVSRNVVPIAKRESGRVPLWGLFARAWHVIEVGRDGADVMAVRQALAVLAAGQAILIAPEGTRSPTLRLAHEGVAFLAAHSMAPVVPVAVDGTEGLPTLRRARRKGQGVVVRFGHALRVRPLPEPPSREVLRAITSEIMGRVASMLPVQRRGVYAESVGAPLIYLAEDSPP